MADELERTKLEPPRLVIEVQGGSLNGLRMPFSATDLAGGVLIGRVEGAQIRFDPAKDLGVSGRHAVLVLENDRLLVHDVGSSNGVYVDGKRVAQGGQPIGEGSRIGIGDRGPVLIVRSGVGKPSAEVAATQKTASVGAPEAAPAAVSAEVEQIAKQARVGARTMVLLNQVAGKVEAREEKSRSKLRLGLVVAGVLLVLGGAAGGWYYLHEQKVKAEAEARAKAKEAELIKAHEEDKKKLAEAVAAAQAAADALARERKDAAALREQLAKAPPGDVDKAKLLEQLKEKERKIEELQKLFSKKAKRRDRLEKRAAAGPAKPGDPPPPPDEAEEEEEDDDDEYFEDSGEGVDAEEKKAKEKK